MGTFYTRRPTAANHSRCFKCPRSSGITKQTAPARQMRHICGSSRTQTAYANTRWETTLARCPKRNCKDTPTLGNGAHARRELVDVQRQVQRNWIFTHNRSSRLPQRGRYDRPPTSAASTCDVGVPPASTSTRHTSQHRIPCPRASNLVGKEQEPPPRKNCVPHQE
ncbi:hypothetical protein GWK47_018375 [Chionoecetes opilio]|uniref:Uncharacterized protein n=1 Tax=Chionoecetes opilio TaxID=41210 RepID=A0A8J4XV57_CHIOP|nr:hypothetical protein GWK47_018375 [Chionoecetes opilio]